MTFSQPLTIAALEFLSLPMLGWLAAAVLPWLIHRLYRRQHRATPWAAVELLLSAMRQRARKIRLQQWLLLAVRTAILTLVALAAAEPALRQWALGARGAAQTHRILVLDQSYSMGSEEQGKSRWQRAVEQARGLIESSDGDAWTLIGWSQQAENVVGRPTFEAPIVLAALENMQVSRTSADVSTATRTILAAIERAKREFPQVGAQQVIFLTDLSRQTWTLDDEQRQLLEQIASEAVVKVLQVTDHQRANVAVTSVTVDPAVTLQQRETTVAATLTCFGKPTPDSAGVELWIEGHRVARQQVQLRADGETTVRFAHRFVDAGAQTVRVVLTGWNDGLASDNSREMIVDVRPQLKVACLAGYPGAADDLSRALSPRSELSNNGDIRSEVIALSQLSEFDLSDFAAVLLCGATELSAREAATLTQYARQGGALAVFPGPATSEESLRELAELLPVRMGPLQPKGDYRFDPREYRHPILSAFRGQAQAGLLGVTVSQYRQLQPREDHPSMEISLRFDSGDPALVTDRVGLGRVAVSALPGSLAARSADGTPWSSFALSPSFLPVVRELITYLVGDRWLRQRNLLVGEPAVFPWVDGARSASVRLPDGTSRSLPLPAAEDRWQLVFHGTDQLGVYRFSADGKTCARFAVNLDNHDGDLRPIDPAELPLGFYDQAVKAAAALPAGGSDFSLVRALLASALVLMLLEIGLAYLLGRGWG